MKDEQSAIVRRIAEICEEFDLRAKAVGINLARLELAKALAEAEDRESKSRVQV